jgi:hypothetical protein
VDTDVLVEQVVSMPIVNPETGAASRTFEFFGKIDLAHRNEIVDWKGTANVARSILACKISFQADCYALALLHRGRHVQQIEYRFITRPGIEYKRPEYSWAVVRPTAKRALKVCDNVEEANHLAMEKGAVVEERVSGDVDRDAYEARCLEWLQEKPARLTPYSRYVTSSRRTETQQWLWDSTKQILRCRLNDRWMPNPKACWTYGYECPFAPVCEGIFDGIHPSQILYIDYERTDPHPELDGHKPTNGKDVVTHSSLSTLASCEVRYYWEYEGCWRRKQAYSEPLWTGSAMHAGMEGIANNGLEAGLAAVDVWAANNLALGPDAVWEQDQQIARARAMCRAAVQKWGGQ